MRCRCTWVRRRVRATSPGDSPPERAHLPGRMLGYPGSVAFRLAACVAACAALSTAAAARADTVPAPCVSTGMFATIAPLGKVPVPVGPSLAAADRQGTTADGFTPGTRLLIGSVRANRERAPAPTPPPPPKPAPRPKPVTTTTVATTTTAKPAPNPTPKAKPHKKKKHKHVKRGYHPSHEPL